MKGDDDRPAYTGPLPECQSCGQPASRGAQSVRCGNCGARWVPTVFRAAQTDSRYVVCPSCYQQTQPGMRHCARCGKPLAAPVPGTGPLSRRLSEAQLETNRRGIERVRAELARAKARGTYDPNAAAMVEHYLDGFNDDGSRKDER